MKKTIASIALAGLIGLSSLNAQELSVSTNVGFETTYVYRGALLADEIATAGIDLSYGGFYAGVWTAQPLDAFDAAVNNTNEIDYYAGFGFDVSDGVAGDIGFTLYDYPEGGGDTFEVFAGLGFDGPLSPSIYAYYDFDLYEETITVEASFGHSFPLSDTSSFDLAAHVGYQDYSDEVAAGGSSSYYLGASADLAFALSDNTSLTVGLRASDLEIGDSEFWGGFSVSAGF